MFHKPWGLLSVMSSKVLILARVLEGYIYIYIYIYIYTTLPLICGAGGEWRR